MRTAQDLISAVANMQQDAFIASKMYMHSDSLKGLKRNVKEISWNPRAYGKTSAIKKFMGIDISINDSVSRNQFVMMDSAGRIKIIEGENNMCYEGQAPETPYERELRANLKDLQKNHLGAQTERFIEMARNEGRSQHLSVLVQELSDKLERTSRELRDYKDALVERDGKVKSLEGSIRSWSNQYYALQRRYDNYKAKHAPKKTAKKTSK